MTPPHALVSGASIAGLSTAFWLSRIGWDVTLIERAPAFRDGGQNIDIRGVAHEVLARMGLEEQVRSQTTTEEGTVFVDAQGSRVGTFPVEETDGFTAELEILRGDLARILKDALPPHVAIHCGTSVTQVQDDHAAARTRVTFADGSSGTYDLVVVAEGVRSSTRNLVFGPQVRRRALGVNIAYATIARTPDDDRYWRWYVAPGARQITLRPDNVGTTRATLAFLDQSADLTDLKGDALLDELDTRFRDAGWQSHRVLTALRESSDVYCDHLTQIDMPTWSRGRTVVVGDAAWCVTPLGGGGTALAMTGGYVLAAHLSQTPHDIPAALQRFEEWMRPLVGSAQKLPPGLPGLAYPRTPLAVRLLRGAVAVASSPFLRPVASRLSHVADTTRDLPDIVEITPT